MKRLLIFLIIIPLLSLSCKKATFGFPDQSDVVRGNSLDIDGVYDMVPSSPYIESVKVGVEWTGLDFDEIRAKATVRFEKGILYVLNDPHVETGAVMVQNIKKIDENTYEGIRTIPTNTSGTEKYKVKTTFLISKNNQLVERISIPEDKGLLEKPFARNMIYVPAESN